MTKQKSNINWYFLIAGIIVLYFGLTNNQNIRRSELTKIKVELKEDITNVNGRSAIDYKFWTKEYKNQFNILNASINSGEKTEAIANLKAGQIVDLYITKSDFELLTGNIKDITIMGIIAEGNSLMTPDEFYHNQGLYKFRIEIFSIFSGIMLVLNGLWRVPKKINYIIIGTFIGLILLMRILEFGLY